MRICNKVSVVVPVYQNAGSIEKTFSAVVNVLKGLELDYKFIFVNDGSTDNSLNEIKELSRIHPEHVKYISFLQNYGQVAALIAGFRSVSGEIGINISADLQDPPEVIIEMINSWKQGKDIVIAKRNKRKDGFLAEMTSKVFYRIINSSNSKIPTGGFDFVLMDAKAIREFNRISERNRFFQGDIVNLGFKTDYISYERKKREIGKSQWTLRKKLKYFVDGVISTSYVPIRLMSLLGVLMSFFGFVYAVVLFVNYFFNGGAFKGWTPILVSIIIVGGVLMVMLGVIGEYLWRIYDELRNRPYYIIEEKSNELEKT